MEKVTVAIPTFFGNKMALNCVDSLLKNVKNPRILVYKNDIGWLSACNKVMQEEQGDIILLNDDTYVLTDIVEAMQSVAYSNESIGIVGGMAVAPNGETIINFGVYMGADGNSAHLYYGDRAEDHDQIENRKAIEGSCMYIKRSVIDAIGYFDEKFGMGYREEVDFCFRAREAGFKIVSTPNARYIHFVSQTNGPLGITNDKYDYFMSKWGNKLKLGKI